MSDPSDNYKHIDKAEKGLSHLDNYKSTLALKASQAKAYAAKKMWGTREDTDLTDPDNLVNAKDFLDAEFRRDFAGHMSDFYVSSALEKVKSLNPDGKALSKEEKEEVLKKLKKDDPHFYDTLTQHYGIISKQEIENVMKNQGEDFWTNYERVVSDQLAPRVTERIQGTLTEKFTDEDWKHIQDRMDLKKHKMYQTRDLTKEELMEAFAKYSIDGELNSEWVKTQDWYDMHLPKKKAEAEKKKGKTTNLKAA